MAEFKLPSTSATDTTHNFYFPEKWKRNLLETLFINFQLGAAQTSEVRAYDTVTAVRMFTATFGASNVPYFNIRKTFVAGDGYIQLIPGAAATVVACTVVVEVH